MSAASRALQLPEFLPTENPNKDGFGCLHRVPNRGGNQIFMPEVGSQELGPGVLVQ